MRAGNLDPKSLSLLGIDNFIRKPLIRLVTWVVFDWVILLVILANCVTLAMDSNRPGFESTPMGVSIQYANYVFIAVFMFEALCKIIALGFVFGEFTYLRNGEALFGNNIQLLSFICTMHDMLWS